MKMHLISIVVHGITYSGFFMFPEGEKPTITESISKAIGLKYIPRGCTYTIG